MIVVGVVSKIKRIAWILWLLAILVLASFVLLQSRQSKASMDIVTSLYAMLAAGKIPAKPPKLVESLNRLDTSRGHVRWLVEARCKNKLDGLWECDCTVVRNSSNTETAVGRFGKIFYVLPTSAKF